ncbi:unnamed protein product [marine sediment metagenome]|uniref:Uncharacterized protein n=1 Tax=marine sediment metagenome TaxID=412755 RepID=X1T1W8_9ZZZZ
MTESNLDYEAMGKFYAEVLKLAKALELIIEWNEARKRRQRRRHLLARLTGTHHRISSGLY